jgi:spermidine/putrescine transport system permease protein
MKSKRLAIPYVIWMAIFVVVPLILVVIYAFTSKSGGFTLDNFTGMGTYAKVFGQSFLLAIVATVICLIIGYPLAYWLSKEGERFRKVAMLLIMLPMWMNFLLRTYAWMSLLENTGIINSVLGALGVFKLINSVFGTDISYFPMINTSGAVVLGMVYNYLPFMILPIYSVIEKIDYRVIEAAQDLGAKPALVFRRVIFPLSMPGVISGITMVFIPSVSTFVISQLLGGGMTMMLGDLIQTQFLGNAYNPYLGSAISLVMMVIVLISMAIMNRFGDGEEGAVMF